MATATLTNRSRHLSFNKTKINLLLDAVLALAFVVELEMHFTGLAIHELLGISLGAALLIHIVLHWGWIVGVTRTFFRNLLHASRFNYALNVLLLADLGVIVVTGILISRTLGLDLSFVQSMHSTLERLHILASNFSLMLVGLHIAVHWKWIASNASKYLVTPIRKRMANSVIRHQPASSL